MTQKHKTKIFNFIDEKIRNGEYKSGEKIPSENELAEQFGCSRLTTRSVLHDLVLLGILDSVRGKGYYISTWADKLLFSSIDHNIDKPNNTVTLANNPDFEINFKKKWADYFGITQAQVMNNSHAFHKTFRSGDKEIVRQKMFVNSDRIETYNDQEFTDASLNSIGLSGIKITNHASLITFTNDEGLKKVAEDLGWNWNYPIVVDVMSDEKSWLSLSIKIVRIELFEFYFAKRIL